MTEQEWWATAPADAKWHTWDKCGKTWWTVRPKWDGHTWHYQGEIIPDYWWHSDTPCPVEIDPSKTLRKRPKETPHAHT